MDNLSCGNRNPPPFRVEPGHRWIVQRRQARVASAPFYPSGRVIGFSLERRSPSLWNGDRHEFGIVIAISSER